MFITSSNSFELKNTDQLPIFSHSAQAPMIYVGCGQESVEMYRGNFDIEDYVEARYPLRNVEISSVEEGQWRLNFEDRIHVVLRKAEDAYTLEFTCLDPKINRFWIRMRAENGEKCYGCGEQMSYFNLRGRHFPLWTSEPGVGRDKKTYVTWRSDVENQGGGDYYNTNFPQASYVSSRRYYLHADCTAYMDFDFRHEDFHELQFWAVPKQIRIESAPTFVAVLERLTAYLGRQPELPDWLYQGAVLGVQGGTQRAYSLTETSLAHGIQVSAVWCQDWCGKRVTSFGKRLEWNWKWNSELYPGLPEKIAEYKQKGIRFFGYNNPYLVEGSELYKEGKALGYFAQSATGGEYLVDFGEFFCGVVDLTNPAAFDWYKELIKKYLIDFGAEGWMCDFGEYLPVDLKLYSGESPMTAHNRWPVLWAKCNHDALVETGNLGKIVYFMRAGGSGSQKYCPMIWGGDQSVDFSIHDGLISVVCGALSAGMSGCGLYHSDIGGYTSLFDNLRTKELFLRWAEMNTFSPMMRTHEGNRPEQNFQYYEDVDTMEQFGRLTRIYQALAPYTKTLVRQNAETGLPVQRALFLHYEGEEAAYLEQTEYLFGRDMLVAPVYLEGAQSRQVYLPEDEWIHLFTGEAYGGGTVTVDAPIGCPPVFYRKASDYAGLFASLKDC